MGGAATSIYQRRLMATGGIHVPVLAREVLSALSPKRGETFIDATFGRGGYSAAILDAADCAVVAVDRDPSAIRYAEALSARCGSRLEAHLAKFGDLLHVAEHAHPGRRFDGVVFDLGLCSDQIADPQRGFSYGNEGSLDMRMGPDASLTAARIVNKASEEVLADIIHFLGEDHLARKLARAIVEARKSRGPIRTTTQLAEIISQQTPGHRRLKGKDGVFRHPAQRTFQGLRICVNDELNELHRGLHAAERLLCPGGRLVVVSFNSLEDTVAKSFFDVCAARRSEEAVLAGERGRQHLDVLPSFVGKRKAVKPDSTEVRANPKARSAKLRTAVRTVNPPLYNLELYLEPPLFQ